MTNLEKYQSLLGSGVDGLLLTSRVSRFYSACYDIAEGTAIVTAAGCRYFTDSRYIEAAEKNIQGFDVQIIDAVHSYSDRIREALADFSVQTLGYEEAYLTVGEYDRWSAELPAQLVPMQEKINAFRAAKEPWEIERMLTAQALTDDVFSQMLEIVRPGMTEKQVAAELIYRFYRGGADGLSFDPIIVSGPNTSLPHGVPGDRVLQKGDFVTMDFGCLLGGYCSDMTRTVALGSVTDEMRAVYDTVLAAQAAGIAATRAGVLGREIHAAASAVIEKAGYGPYFGHGYGHSLGIEIHEAPNCNPAGTTPMPVGAVCSAEPGIYLPGRFGVRIEDVVIFEENGCRDITKSPKELIVL